MYLCHVLQRLSKHFQTCQGFHLPYWFQLLGDNSFRKETNLKENVLRSTVNCNYGGNYMRPGRTQTGMSSYRSPHISIHAFTWDRPKSELRPAWHRVGSELLSYRSETVPFSCKTETNLRAGPQTACFIVWLRHFLLFLSKIKTLLWITVNNTWK